MNLQRFLSLLMIFACLAGATAVFIQARALGTLREKQQLLLAGPGTNSDSQSAAPAEPADSAAPQSLSSELLQLRSQVGQLTERKRELANAAAENAQLHAELTNRASRQLDGIPLPPDYIRKNQAQWQGLSTPENTIQSFLWALQNHDATNLSRVLADPDGQGLMQALASKPEEFYQHADALPGLRIVRQEQSPDGSVKIQVEFIPGSPSLQWLTFRRVGAEWKLQF